MKKDVELKKGLGLTYRKLRDCLGKIFTIMGLSTYAHDLYDQVNKVS